MYKRTGITFFDVPTYRVPTICFAEYVWIDGTSPVQKLRSKGKVAQVRDGKWEQEPIVNEWNFDGSSTKQAKGDDSERLLDPVRIVSDPLREGHFLVLCEVLNPDGTPHESNQRSKLRETLGEGEEGSGAFLGALWGFEQEYCFMDKRTDAILIYRADKIPP